MKAMKASLYIEGPDELFEVMKYKHGREGY